MPPLSTPLASSKFNLNSAGVAGFFGGNEAISAMATVHLYKGRRWLGWFNSPGSYTIAKRFGRMANSRFWDGLFPGSHDSPAVTLGLDSKMGPQYVAPFSGTTMRAGHLAYLTMERIKEHGCLLIEGRKTSSFEVAYLVMKNVDLNAIPIELEPLESPLLGLLPIAVSVVTCVICALVHDWLSFSMILIGIISSGLASWVIGEGRLSIESVTNPACESPPAHGLLLGERKVVVIKGEEKYVNIITKGRFELKTSDGKSGGKEKGDEEKGGEGESREVGVGKESIGTNGDVETGNKNSQEMESNEKGTKHTNSYHMIGVSSLLLLLQFLVQLLLVPQGSLFGQIMFLVSLGASWAYNSYLSSLEKEKIQTKILWRAINDPVMLQFRTDTRTAMTVFACLLVFHEVDRSSMEGYDDHEVRLKILNACIPNDTPVWRRWKDKVVQQLLSIDNSSASELLPYLKEDAEDRKLPEQQRGLLRQLLTDAESAFNGYFQHRAQLNTSTTPAAVEENQEDSESH